MLGLTSLTTLGIASLSGASSSARSGGASGTVVVEKRYSSYRHKHVEVVYRLPSDDPPPGMPMALLLHGRGSSARRSGFTGLPSRLAGAVTAARIPPFGFVAVDGGNSYWHEHRSGDDPMGMLLEEVPTWLRERGLARPDGLPFACAGVSMGGFGALLYARRRGERGKPLDAVAAVAPALMPWARMRKRRAWHSQYEWRSMDPLHNIAATKGVPTAVWCGTDDPFIDGVRAFVRRASPEIAHLAPGGHNGRFFRSAVPGLLGFLGAHVQRRR